MGEDEREKQFVVCYSRPLYSIVMSTKRTCTTIHSGVFAGVTGGGWRFSRLTPLSSVASHTLNISFCCCMQIEEGEEVERVSEWLSEGKDLTGN